jgi:hypothetical protein
LVPLPCPKLHLIPHPALDLVSRTHPCAWCPDETLRPMPLAALYARPAQRVCTRPHHARVHHDESTLALFRSKKTFHEKL